ncbi:hypothetical protein SEPCBS57363_004600 [Sporothrix epigloea]|uniref:BHLH domain-containing protein n=1 Tax=Sporothrix epigloea TaxID=1892477 RepID=A0ABP0DSZ5_9PEZI
MMGSSAWNGQDHSMDSTVDEDFQQFLDMSSMSNLAGNIQYSFTDFQNTPSDASHIIHTSTAPVSNTLVTPMTGAHNTPGLLAQNTTGPLSDLNFTGTTGFHGAQHTHNLLPAATTAGSAHASIATTMMPVVSPNEAISEIDAQIQYLQLQRMQQQQRQVEEQKISYFTQQNHIVPPTPQSLELQAGNQFFHSPDPRNQHQNQQPRQQAIYDRYQHLKEQQDMSFTPLVSPAVTPLETQFSIDTQYIVPGAYFSPLTSPALHAQPDLNFVFDPRLNHASTSPLDIDVDMEMLPAAAANSSGPSPMSETLAKKARRKNASKARKSNVRQSPIVKPMRKKSTSTPVMNAQILDQLVESLEHESLTSPVIHTQSQQQDFHQNHSMLASSHMQFGDPSPSATGTTDSENDSVSPKPLNDMPPPPVPLSRSGRPSPYLYPQKNNEVVLNGSMAAPNAPVPAVASVSLSGAGFPSPATPASLMKLASPNHKAHRMSPLATTTNREGTASGSKSVGGSATASVGMANEHIEMLELPESLSMDFPKPNEILSSACNTPTVEAAASPFLDISSSRVFQPLSSPSITKPGSGSLPGTRSATQSPRILPGNHSLLSTPTLATNSNRKTPQMLPQGAIKKRPSVISVPISPALRPRISPSIKPLLPGGGSTVEEQASRLLTTKSNYQNILEGNLLPGISYPSELSTNLTSKRTSHKIAEQGRRNRINTALQEIAMLLPAQPSKDIKADIVRDDEDCGDDNGDRKKDGKAGAVVGNNSAPNSKASTIELAIEYIKQLTKEVADMKKRAEEAEAKLKQQSEGEMV